MNFHGKNGGTCGNMWEYVGEKNEIFNFHGVLMGIIGILEDVVGCIMGFNRECRI
jgi:hypothetical protein